MSIDEILTALARTWNDGDAEAYADLFAPEAGFVDVLGRLQQGRTVIAREHEVLFTSFYRGSTTSYRLIDERLVARGVVLAHTVGRLDVPAGPRAGVTHSTQTLLVEHSYIIAFHNVVQSDLLKFAGQDQRTAAAALMDGSHQDPRV